MYKIRLIFLIVLIGLVPSLVFGEKKDKEKDNRETEQAAEEIPEEQAGEQAGDEAEKAKSKYLNDEFQLTVNGGVGFSAYQWHFTGGVQADFNANPVMGVGIKTTVDYGLKYDNLNINLYLVYKLWWFYFGPGVSFIVTDMNIPADDPDYKAVYNDPDIASLAFTAGFRFPFARIGPGHLTMDLSVDWYQTDIPLSEVSPPYDGHTLDELLNGTTYAFKFGARLGYTF
jgi:hypothetical protein